MKFSIKDFFSKCDQICRKLRIWSNLLKRSLTENFIFVHCIVFSKNLIMGPYLSSLDLSPRKGGGEEGGGLKTITSVDIEKLRKIEKSKN